MQHRLTYGPDCSRPGSTTRTRRVFWRLLGISACRTLIVKVCGVMSRDVERRRGPPALESRRAVVRLWHIDAYQSVSRTRGAAWRLSDGMLLRVNDPVLEMHIAADMLIPLVSNGTPWRVVIEEEFRSMSWMLQQRPEVALVGDTILRRQVLEFGASVRDPPPGPRRMLDTFYRRLILLAFHPRGVARAMQDNECVVEVAISRADFLRRFGVGSCKSMNCESNLSVFATPSPTASAAELWPRRIKFRPGRQSTGANVDGCQK